MGRKGRKPITKIGGFNIFMLVVATLLAGFVIFLWTVVGLTKEQWDGDGHHYKTVYACSDKDTCDKEEHVHTLACYVKDEPAAVSEVDEVDDSEPVEDSEDVVDEEPVGIEYELKLAADDVFGIDAKTANDGLRLFVDENGTYVLTGLESLNPTVSDKHRGMWGTDGYPDDSSNETGAILKLTFTAGLPREDVYLESYKKTTNMDSEKFGKFGAWDDDTRGVLYIFYWGNMNTATYTFTVNDVDILKLTIDFVPAVCETEVHTHTMVSKRVYYGPDWTKHFLDRYEGIQAEGIFNNLNLMQFTTLLTVVDFVLLLVFISIIASRARYLKRHKNNRPGIKRGDHFGGRPNPPAPPAKKKSGKKDSKNPEPPPPTVHNGQIRRRR